MSKTILLGISGGSGSGKSTLAAELAERIPGAVHVSSDRYFKKELPTLISPLDGKEYPDWNHPTSIHSDAMIEDLRKMMGEHGVIIAEGAFIYCIPELREMLDLKLWVDCTIELRLFRRITRNMVTKGQTVDFIGGYYLAAARYREAEFSLPSRKYADMIVQNEKADEYKAAIPEILNRVEGLLK